MAGAPRVARLIPECVELDPGLTGLGRHGRVMATERFELRGGASGAAPRARHERRQDSATAG